MRRIPAPSEGPEFFIENSRTWNMEIKAEGPGKCWENMLKGHAFF